MTGENKYAEESRRWDECMMRIGRKLTYAFDIDNTMFTDALISTNCTRHLMRWIYRHMVAKNRIVALEHLDINAKKQMWSFVVDICAGRLNDKEKMKEVAMAFYVIEYFLNEKH